MNENILSYFAGLFDGEGCVFLNTYKDHKNSKNYNHALRVQIANTNPLPLLRAKELFGGSIYEHKDSRKNRRTTYSWRGSHLIAKEFLLSIYPYSIIKTREIEVALAFRDIKMLEYRRGNKYTFKGKEELNIFDFCKEQLQELKRKEHTIQKPVEGATAK